MYIYLYSCILICICLLAGFSIAFNRHMLQVDIPGFVMVYSTRLCILSELGDGCRNTTCCTRYPWMKLYQIILPSDTLSTSNGFKTIFSDSLITANPNPKCLSLLQDFSRFLD